MLVAMPTELTVLTLALACAQPRPAASERPSPSAVPGPSTAPSSAGLPTSASSTDPSSELAATSGAPIASSAPTTREPGPFSIEFLPKRSAYVVAARDATRPARLIAMLHGLCNPPEYACGLWEPSAPALGFLICPAGDGSCGKAQYDAPTWIEGDAEIDADLERAIARTVEVFPDAIERDDAVLCGFSRGAYVAVKIATAHPGRWPYLVLNEANVTLSVDQLRAAKVRAVALIAGEFGGQIVAERATVARLQKAGFPARFWPMPKAGHWYSDDIARIMTESIDFVTSVPE